MKINALKGKVIAGARALLGDGAIDSLLLRRNFAEYRTRGIIFIHVPKCAGSSVSRALYGRSLGHHPAAKLQNHDSKTFGALTTFAVLRDPVSRAYSAWQYARSGGTEEGWAAARETYEDEAFATFEAFAARWLPSQDAAALDFVFQPQAGFICDAQGKVIVERLVPLGKLAEIWPSLVAGKPVANQELGRRNVNRKASAGNADITDVAAAAIRSYYARDEELYRGLLA